MAEAVTYGFYSQVYGGGLSEAAFGDSPPSAVRHVKWLCDARDVPSHDEGAYMRAVCAAVDAFAEYGEGQSSGFSIGDFKVTHYSDDEGVTGEQVATQLALKELAGTGLAFTGVR